MKSLVARKWIIRKLLPASNFAPNKLVQLRSAGNNNQKCGIIQRIINYIFRRYFNKEASIIEHWTSKLPFSSNFSCFGHLDFIHQLENQQYAIRGWIFDINSPIRSLSLIYNNHRYPVYAFKLNRSDVAAALGIFKHASLSGFVTMLKNLSPGNEPVSITFEAILQNNKLVTGTFEKCPLTTTPGGLVLPKIE